MYNRNHFTLLHQQEEIFVVIKYTPQENHNTKKQSTVSQSNLIFVTFTKENERPARTIKQNVIHTT